MEERMADRDQPLEALRTYTDGKMERYKLLFAVNGGAFAIGRLLLEKHSVGLTMPQLSLGAVLFTLLLHFDIWAFAMMMRNSFGLKEFAFKTAGRLILVCLCSLLVAAWSFSIGSWLLLAIGIAGIAITAAYHLLKPEQQLSSSTEA
jgi:hypothetical protein